MNVNQFPDRIIKVNQVEYLYFGGTAYLGLPANKAFQKLVVKNILNWGTTYGSSRNANIQLTAYTNGETFLAKYIKAEAAVTVSSGMLAGKLVLDTLQKDTDCFFYFQNIHPAIQTLNSKPVLIDGKLNPRLVDATHEKITILTDGVLSLQTEAVDLSILKEIPNHKKITLVIDESHSLGILGENGCGIFSTITLSIQRKIMISSLGKAFGVTGGVIASDIDFIEKIKQKDIFVSAAGMNPAFIQTVTDASAIYISQHQKLVNNTAYFYSKLTTKQNILASVNYPLVYIENEKITKYLLQNNIIVANFKYQENTKDLNRIVITANHTTEDLDKITSVLNQYNYESKL